MVARPELLGSFIPSPPLATLDDETAALIAIRAANGAGKTQHMARIVALRALAKPNSRHRVVGPTHSQVRNVIGRYLWQLLKPYCADGSMWRPGTGWNRNGIISLRNGAEIELKAYKDDPDSHEGPHGLDTIVLDEVPTKAHYFANKGRARMLIIGFTVQKAPPLWLKREVQGTEESPTRGRTEHKTGWVQYVIPFMRENVPWYSDEDYSSKAGKYIGTEYERTRIWADWEATTDARRFTGYGPTIVKSREAILRMLRGADGKLSIDRARYGVSYGTGDRQYQTLILQKGSTFFQVAEYVGGPRDRMFNHAKALRDAVNLWLVKGPRGLRILAGDEKRPGGVYGDILDAGPGGGGDSMNELLAEQVCKVYGIDELPFEVQAPSRLPSDKGARELAINHAMLEGRWFVCDECETAVRAYQQYEGTSSDPLRIPIMAASYAVSDIMLARERADSGVTLHR